jgi:hypothetical protein
MVASTDYASWAAVAAAVGALITAVVALLSDRFYRRRDALSKLLDRFEAAGFYVLMWRGERIGRPGEDASSLDPINIEDLEKRCADDAADSRRIAQLLAKDPESNRAVMHEIYFFALQTHAWLTTSRSFRRRRTRLINDTFGYQLLSTLLDHRTFACRLRRTDKPQTYFPEQWGCLDPAYRDLVKRLASELLHRRRRPLSPGLADPLRRKLAKTERALDEFAAVD